MDIIRSLTEKSWLTVDSAGPEDLAREDEIVVSAAPTGLRVYFAVATVLFLIIGAAYLMRMGMGQATAIDWRPTPKPWLLWLNSAFLIFSSLVFQRARIGTAAVAVRAVWAMSGSSRRRDWPMNPS